MPTLNGLPDVISAWGDHRRRHSEHRIFKSVSGVPTSFYYALPSRIYRRFSRQSKLRLAWYKHVTPSSPPSSSPHLSRSSCTKQAIRVRRYYASCGCQFRTPFNHTKLFGDTKLTSQDKSCDSIHVRSPAASQRARLRS